jgi:hypothetical protein
MEIPFIGGCYIERSPNLSSQQCQNLFPVIDDKEAKAVLSLMNIAGLTSWVNVGQSGRYEIHIEGGLPAGSGAVA